MEIGPIFRALLRNKTRFWLITVEVALTLAITANCTMMINHYRGQLLRPTGMDEEHLLVVTAEPFGEQLDDAMVDTLREDDLRKLRAFPGVRAATVISAAPLSGSGSSTGRKQPGSELESLAVPFYIVGDQALQSLGVELVAGRDLGPEDFQATPISDPYNDPALRNVLVTQALADRLFPDEDALGRELADGDGDIREVIVGIVRRMHCSWPTSPGAEYVMLRPGKPGNERQLRYLVRTEPGATDSIFGELEGVLLEVHNERMIGVRGLSEIKAHTYRDSLLISRILGAVIVLLILVTTLGIVGLTSFSVTQRTRQIGTRRALGATRGDIVRYFVVEAWMITGFGLLLGGALAYSLNYALVNLAGAPSIDTSLLLAGTLLLWLAGVLAALVPSLRASGVAPEIATRTV